MEFSPSSNLAKPNVQRRHERPIEKLNSPSKEHKYLTHDQMISPRGPASPARGGLRQATQVLAESSQAQQRVPVPEAEAMWTEDMETKQEDEDYAAAEQQEALRAKLMARVRTLEATRGGSGSIPARQQRLEARQRRQQKPLKAEQRKVSWSDAHPPAAAPPRREEKATTVVDQDNSAAEMEKRVMKAANPVLSILKPSMLLSGASLSVVMGARPLLAMDCFKVMGHESVLGPLGLANAQSLGSLMDLCLQPIFGRVSDTYGRRPIILLMTVLGVVTKIQVMLTPMGRRKLQFLFVDAMLYNVIGTKAMLNAMQAMLGDLTGALPAGKQAQVRSNVITYATGGLMAGGLIGGAVMARFGNAATYWASSLLAGACYLNFLFRLPESKNKSSGNAEEDDEKKKASSVVAPQRGGGAPAEPTKKKNAYLTILTDPEALCWTLMTSLRELCLPTAFADVNTLFLTETVGMSPALRGSFNSYYMAGTMVATGIAGPLIKLLGDSGYLFMSNLTMVATFLCWGSARSSRMLFLSVPPLTALSFGGMVVQYSRLMTRTAQLGLGKGETMAVPSIIAAIMRMLVPRLNLKLYRLTPGGPFYLIAATAVLIEVLHRMAQIAAAMRTRSERRSKAVVANDHA